MLVTLKPRNSYMLMVRWSPSIMVVFHLLETSPMVRNVRFLDIICRKGVPCTKKKSAQRETSRWRFLMEISMGIWVYVGIDKGNFRVLLPCK